MTFVYNFPPETTVDEAHAFHDLRGALIYLRDVANGKVDHHPLNNLKIYCESLRCDVIPVTGDGRQFPIFRFENFMPIFYKNLAADLEEWLRHDLPGIRSLLVHDYLPSIQSLSDTLRDLWLQHNNDEKIVDVVPCLEFENFIYSTFYKIARHVIHSEDSDIADIVGLQNFAKDQSPQFALALKDLLQDNRIFCHFYIEKARILTRDEAETHVSTEGIPALSESASYFANFYEANNDNGASPFIVLMFDCVAAQATFQVGFQRKGDHDYLISQISRDMNFHISKIRSYSAKDVLDIINGTDSTNLREPLLVGRKKTDGVISRADFLYTCEKLLDELLEPKPGIEPNMPTNSVFWQLQASLNRIFPA